MRCVKCSYYDGHQDGCPIGVMEVRGQRNSKYIEIVVVTLCIAVAVGVVVAATLVVP